MLIPLKHHHRKASLCLLKVLACLKPQPRTITSMFSSIWSYTNGATRHTSELASASVNPVPWHLIWSQHKYKNVQLGQRILLYGPVRCCVYLHLFTRSLSYTCTETRTSVYILTHKHILCLGNRLHMVGSGRGPEDFLSFLFRRWCSETRSPSARTLFDVDRTEHGGKPVEWDRLAVDRHVLDASHKGRCDRKRHLRHHHCATRNGGKLVKWLCPYISRTLVICSLIHVTFWGIL